MGIPIASLIGGPFPRALEAKKRAKRKHPLTGKSNYTIEIRQGQQLFAENFSKKGKIFARFPCAAAQVRVIWG